jgi:hypothetical protein
MRVEPILERMLALRAAFAVGVVVLAVVLLRQGLPLGAFAVIVAGVFIRRSAESGLLHRLATHPVRSP